MKVLVTGSAGHLGEALVRTLLQAGRQTRGLDLLASPYTSHPGSLLDRGHVRKCLEGIDTVFHAATLHKPHVGTHAATDFIDVNLTGTQILGEEAVAAGVQSLIFTSTTSVFGDALVPPAGMPAAWVTETVTPVPKNIYGVTKAAAEDLCRLFHRNAGLPVVILRTARFFPEPDDDPAQRTAYDDTNLKVNEYLFRRADVADVVSAHLLAAEHAASIGCDTYIISATTPFLPEDLPELRRHVSAVVQKRVPAYGPVYRERHWKLPPSLDRVYVNEKARLALGWQPEYDFREIVERLGKGKSPFSPLAGLIGSKGYHRAPGPGL